MNRTHHVGTPRIEPEVGIERDLNERLEIEQAADGHRTRDRVGGLPARVPVGGDQHRREMATCGMPRDDQSLNRQSVARPFAAQPRDGLPTFVDDLRNPDGGAKIVVHDGNADARSDQRRRHEGVIGLVERPPVPAVDEQHRPSRVGRREQIHGLVRPVAVANIEPRIEAAPRHSAVGGPAREPLRVIGKRGAKVVFALDEIRSQCAHSLTLIAAPRCECSSYPGLRCARRAGRPPRRRLRPTAFR